MNKITVYFNESAQRKPETFETTQGYNCQGGFFMIYEKNRSISTVTLFPESQVARIVVIGNG